MPSANSPACRYASKFAGGISVKQFARFAALSTISAVLLSGAAFAQPPHDNQAYVEHKEWKKGYHMNHDDWARGEQVDWHAHHLRTPPRGYEWRQVDGNYVLAAVATGIIASAIVASAAH
jgi:Ni/Co efflux regulator RcnB